MTNFKHTIPHYLLQKRNIIQLVLFTALFALVFINIYAPFGVEHWFNIGKWGLLAYSSLIIITGVLVVVISRIIMYHYSKHHTINLNTYFIWVAVEVLCMALFYTLFEKFILDDDRFFMDMLKISIQNTALVLLLPYSVLWLYFSWVDKKRKLEELETPLSNSSRKQMISFHDERNVLRLSLKLKDILYLESADNYVNIHYLNKGKKERYLLRSTLKRLELDLPNALFLRCHRSFLVNIIAINSIKRKKEGVFLELETDSAISIPVSKTYIQNVITYFSN